jgi:hypothetical protein
VGGLKELEATLAKKYKQSPRYVCCFVPEIKIRLSGLERI